MKRAVQELRSEHELVASAATSLRRIAEIVVRGGTFDASSALELVEFLRDSANVYHQRKEEEGLFPALFEQGLARARVAELLADHVRERVEMAEIAECLQGAAYGDWASLDRFVCLAERYAVAQLAHATWEESILLPLADELLDDVHDAAAVRRYQEIDAEAGTRAVRARAGLLRRIAERVEEESACGAACACPTPA